MKKIGGIFLAVLTFFASTLNVFAQAIEEVVEEKTQTINKEDYESLKEKVEKKVIEMNESDDEYVYDYEISIIEEKEEVIITEKETITSQEKFTSASEAQKYYDEYNLDEAWKKGELTITSQDENIKVNGNEITIYCEAANCEDEIKSIEESLNQYQELEVISKKTIEKDDTKKIIYSINGIEQELTAEEAARIIFTLKPELEGYTFIKNEAFLTRKGSADIKTYQELYGNVKFETEEEAKTALEEFLSRTDYQTITGVIASIMDPDETKIEKFSTKGHLTKELAEQAALAELNLSINGSTIIVSKAYEKEIEEIENIQDMEFENELEAAAYLAEKLTEGYIASNIKYEEGQTVNTGEIIVEGEVKPIKKVYTIPLTSTYIIIDEQDKDNIVVWTSTEWTNKQKEEFKSSAIEKYKKINENTNIEYITGYKTFDLSYLGKKWSDAYTINPITINDKEIGRTLTLDKKENTSKVYQGTTLSYKKVLLNCTLTKKTTLWYVDLQKTTLGYDYVIVGGASTIIRDLFKVQSILTGKIYDYTMAYKVNTTNTYTSYIASFDIYKEEIKTSATVAYKITKEKVATGSTNPDAEDDKNNKDNNNQQQKEEQKTTEENIDGTGTVLPPNTGVQVNFFLEGALLISILVVAASLKKLCK